MEVAKKIKCAYEHNGDDTLRYALEYVGAFTRGSNLGVAIQKMPHEIESYLKWLGTSDEFDTFDIEICEQKLSELCIRDADSDIIFDNERAPMSYIEYQNLRSFALRSANDFYTLYRSVPQKNVEISPERKTFYGKVPCTAYEMYEHTKNVNSYYFSEIGIDTNNDGNIVECCEKGFELLERKTDFLYNRSI